jgi:hypothetical protein
MTGLGHVKCLATRDVRLPILRRLLGEQTMQRLTMNITRGLTGLVLGCAIVAAVLSASSANAQSFSTRVGNVEIVCEKIDDADGTTTSTNSTVVPEASGGRSGAQAT